MIRIPRTHPISIQFSDGVMRLPYGPTQVERRTHITSSQTRTVREALGHVPPYIDLAWWIAIPENHYREGDGHALRVIADPHTGAPLEQIDISRWRALWPKHTEKRIAFAGSDPQIVIPTAAALERVGVEILVGGLWHPDSWKDPNCPHDDKQPGVVCAFCAEDLEGEKRRK